MLKSADIVKKVPMEVVGVSVNRPKAIFDAEIADNEPKRRTGLSKRASLPVGEGMFFDIPGPFWMKDVSFPLDLVYLTKQGEITEIITMYPDLLPEVMKPIYKTSSTKSAYALELPGGWCKSRGIKSGDYVKVSKTLKKVQT